VSLTFLLLTIAPPAIGVLAGYLSGGRLAGFRTLRIRALWLVWLAAAVQFAQYSVRGARGLLVLVFAIVLVWLAVNLPRWPAAIRVAGLAIVLGAALNALVIGLNGRMPYNPGAAAQAGLHADVVTPKNMPADERTRLPSLGDIIPIPPLHKVASPGDVLISGGAAALVLLAMRRARTTEEEEATRVPDRPVAAGGPDGLHPGPIALARLSWPVGAPHEHGG
jgi:hypothetical protein